jgi:hypothetical protein
MYVIEKPIGVYLNWASYDELSDNIELTETLAMHQLDHAVRLRDAGVQIDYYVMDAFWFAKDGGYRVWRRPHWPDGPGRWLDTCIRHGIQPGLWLGANNPAWMHVIPEWQDSFDPQTGCMCCFYGGFLPHYIDTLHHWYDQGVRLFKFDFSDFSAAPPHIKEALLPSEIRTANVTAFRGALKAFRQAHPDVLLIAYNGFEERTIQNSTDEPRAKVVDHRWLEVFDSIYCGDARPADVPAMNFWRSKDIYSDHMVRRYLENDIPLRRIDNAGFMIGTTGTCYFRGTAAWRGMLVLSLARGGWVNSYYGNLDLLSDEDAAWFGKVQRLFFRMQARGSQALWGGVPGDGQPYGYLTSDAQGGLITLVNPSQHMARLSLPGLAGAVVLFSDAGHAVRLEGDTLTLGPEQMALLGTGDCAGESLGIEPDVVVPEAIQPAHVSFAPAGRNTVQAQWMPDAPCTLRVVMKQVNALGRGVRLSGGSPPDGQSLGKMLRITAVQGASVLPLDLRYDRVIWSGLSWAVGEVNLPAAREPVTITCASAEVTEVTLTCAGYIVSYAAGQA